MDERERVRWAQVITTAGWLFLAAYVLFVAFQVRSAFALRRGDFEDGLWGQRVEQISFAAFPQNLAVLVPAAAAGIVATLLARGITPPRPLWSRQLVRLTAGMCYVVVAIAGLGIVDVFFRSPDGVGDLGAILQRLGGIFVAIAIIHVSLEAERTG